MDIVRKHRVGLSVVVTTVALLVYWQLPAWATVTVSPSTNLPDTANVNVSGTGFAANQAGTLQECQFSPQTTVEECKDIGSFTTNAQGNFGPVPVTVTRTYTSINMVNVNCNTGLSCRVVATLNNVQGTQEAPITFGDGGTTSTSSTTSTTTSSTTSTTTSTTSSTTTTTVNPLICDGLTATIVGTSGNDSIVGTPGPDVIVGLGGDDQIQGLGGDDRICGGEGADQLDGGDGNDRLFGGGGNDRVLGGPGSNNVFGQAGLDQCFVTPTSTASTCEQVLPQP